MTGRHAGPAEVVTETEALIKSLEVEANQLQRQLFDTGLGPDQIRRRTYVLTEIYRLKALNHEMRRYVQ